MFTLGKPILRNISDTMDKQTVKVTDTDNVVIRFSGDSGDGMQLTGTLFSNLSAILGNEISTFPDFPAEIRAILWFEGQRRV